MRTLLNIIWIIFGGLVSAIMYFIAGLIFCITIIGIPFGLQLFKLSRLVLTPFGSSVETNFFEHPILNIIWLIFFGWYHALLHLVTGTLFFVTIIGIPFALQRFKLAILTLFPFGAKIE